MRLLNSYTLHFETFLSDDACPPNAILSHTWGAEEVSYQDMMYERVIDDLNQDLGDASLQAALMVAARIQFSKGDGNPTKERRGYQKIVKGAQIARERNLSYVWIDTCCIYKESSAELQEAINSMWRWYKRSTYCIVYLEDDPRMIFTDQWIANYDPSRLVFKIGQSRWITRGWILQELIAPKELGFYDISWRYMCSKRECLASIQEATHIPQYVLSTGDLSQCSIAQKMSWASDRETTCVEDKAYSLIGLLGVHAPMLYGEGANAFQRLQEEIIKIDPDDSILAWHGDNSGLAKVDYTPTIRGPLAASPRDFRQCSSMQKGIDSAASMTLEGSRWLRLRGYHTRSVVRFASDLIIMLNARHTVRGAPVMLTGLKLKTGGPEEKAHREYQCIRIDADRIDRFERTLMIEEQRTEVWFSLRPTINWDFSAPHAYYYRFQRAMRESEGYQHPCGGFTISSIHPKENWDPTQKALLIRRDVLGQELTYCGIFLLTPQISRDHVSTYLLVNFDQLSRKFWWASFRADPGDRGEDASVYDEFWQQDIDSMTSETHTTSSMVVDGVLTCVVGGLCWCSQPIRCQMRPGIWNEKLALISSIEGLIET